MEVVSSAWGVGLYLGLKPRTGGRMTRARTDVEAMDTDITAAFKVVRQALAAADGSREDIALASLETFVVIALRVMRKTNPSKIRSEAMTVEIKARIDGIPVMSTEGLHV